MEKEDSKGGGLLNALAGLVYVFLLFGLFSIVIRELRKGNILMWIYVIAVTVYICIYGEEGLT